MCIKGHMNKSAITKNAWTEDHPICWEGMKILQCTMDLVGSAYKQHLKACTSIMMATTLYPTVGFACTID